MDTSFRSHHLRALIVILVSALTLIAALVPASPANADAMTFANASPIAIPGSGTVGVASTYGWPIQVFNTIGVITDVDVAIYRIDHARPDDLDILLVAPNGQAVVLMSDACGASRPGATLRFDDQMTRNLPQAGPCAGGMYRPTNYNTGTDAFPVPAPAGTFQSLLSQFNGIDPDGYWTLYVYDDTINISGSIGEWALFIDTAPLPDSELVHNGTFDRFLEGWGFWGVSSSSEEGGLALALQAGAASGGFYQFMNYAAGELQSYELSLNMRNTGGTPKTLNIMVRSQDWSEVYNCFFTALPNGAQGQYIMRFRTAAGTTLYPMVLQGWLSGDTNRGLVVDNISVRRKLAEFQKECIIGGPPANVNLIYNGEMLGNLSSTWAPFNATMTQAQINGDSMMEIYRNPGTPNGGFYQWNPNPASPNGFYAMTLKLGNRSASRRTVHILLRNPSWSERRSCWITVPANTPLSPVMLQFRAQTAWENIVVQVWLQDDSGAPALQFDAIRMSFVPNAQMADEVACWFNGQRQPGAQAAAPAPIAPLELPVNTIAVAPIDPAQMGEGGILAAPAVELPAAPPAEAAVAAPVEEAKPGE